MRVTNKKGMKFDCTRLMKWAEEKLGKSKCTAIAFTWDPTEESCGWYNWDETIWYNHYNVKYGYKNNPYELAAREYEKLVKRAYKKQK
jgi:hypothetical protein